MSFGDVQRLRAFALVLDLGSISAAATVLGYTQSAVSQQLAALEREIGAALVDRAQRPLRATPAGTALRPHVDRVLAALAAPTPPLDDLRGGRRRAAAGRLPQRAVLVRAGRAARPAPRAPGPRRPRAPARDAARRSTGCAAATPISPWSITCPASRCPRRRACERRHLLVDHLHVALPRATGSRGATPSASPTSRGSP